MTDLIAAKLLDDAFADTLAGYRYSITLNVTGSAYTAEAVPASTNTGRFGYYSHPDAVVRYTTLIWANEGFDLRNQVYGFTGDGTERSPATLE